MSQLQTILHNVSPLVRYDTLEGQEYLVLPMVMLVEGVHNGTGGPLLYTEAELKNLPQKWNHKPVIVYHPQPGTSACDPEVLNNRKIGVILNTTFEDGKLKAEAWINKERLEVVDKSGIILEAIENGDMVELSTGVWSECVANAGEWEGEAYEYIAHNLTPDHLAILPDLVGACSIADGAGLLRCNAEQGDKEFTIKLSDCKDDPDGPISQYIKNNRHLFQRKVARLIENEISFDDIRVQLNSKIRDQFDNADGEYVDVWVEDVFDDYFIYLKDGELYKQDYTNGDGVIKFEGVPTNVVKEVSYKTKTIITNKKTEFEGKDSKMKKDEMVKSLIENEGTQWLPEDKDVLDEMTEDVLAKLVPVANEEPAKEEPAKEEPAQDVPTGDVKTEEAKPVENIDFKNMPVEQYIANHVHPDMRDVVRAGLLSHNKDKTDLITGIIANERNVFTQEQLNDKPLEELQALARLAIPVSNARYDGQGDGAQNIGNNGQKPLGKPAMDFSGRKP